MVISSGVLKENVWLNANDLCTLHGENYNHLFRLIRNLHGLANFCFS